MPLYAFAEDITNEQYFKDCFDLVILVKGKQELTDQKLKKLSWHGKKSLVNWNIKLLKTTNLLVIDNNSSIKHLKNTIKKLLNNFLHFMSETSRNNIL